ncbi:ATP-binding cassette domain-containing protein [Nocardia aurantia]|uniref:Vitamin B12 import ATP-binding protein BtuD n=1 Tax=Nocardia aurantia TaxID=2585199 RepID=A0A7K0DQM3_9NOCA|nr:ATP-binding cassette domain-containing protein [Nocardia aurantia]MQY28075.1 Vitamin B12 import ATP-binding protein BtuD [Nocardia aurantia]
MDTALELAGVGKRFGTVRALSDVDITVRRGEVHCVLGENGAGKSTLCNLVYGSASPDAGRMRLFGEPYRPRRPADALRRGIAMVHQHFSLVPTLTVAENLLLGPASRLRLRRANLTTGLAAVADEFGLRVDPAARVETLSVGERQTVEIVKCLLAEPNLVLLDEPTAVLGPTEVTALLDTCRRIAAAAGRAVVLITHKLGEIERAADTATVLRAGRVVGSGPLSGFTRDDLVGLMVGRRLADLDPLLVLSDSPTPTPATGDHLPVTAAGPATGGHLSVTAGRPTVGTADKHATGADVSGVPSAGPEAAEGLGPTVGGRPADRDVPLVPGDSLTFAPTEADRSSASTVGPTVPGADTADESAAATGVSAVMPAGSGTAEVLGTSTTGGDGSDAAAGRAEGVVGTGRTGEDAADATATGVSSAELTVGGTGAADERATPPTVLRITGLRLARADGAPLLDGLDLELRAGEITGIAGVEGNGQSELVAVLSGARRPDAGLVEFAGRDMTRASPAARTAAGLGVIPEDRHHEGCIPAMSVAENLCLGRLHRFRRRGLLDRRAVSDTAAAAIAAHGIRASSPAAPMHTLSGGNQQKVVVARELALDPLRCLVAAQPTRGLDLAAVDAVLTQLRGAAAAGAAVLLVSHELPELLTLCDRVFVAYRGRLLGPVHPAAGHAADTIARLMLGAGT